jgi:hypothetical protein
MDNTISNSTGKEQPLNTIVVSQKEWIQGILVLAATAVAFMVFSFVVNYAHAQSKRRMSRR